MGFMVFGVICGMSIGSRLFAGLFHLILPVDLLSIVERC